MVGNCAKSTEREWHYTCEQNVATAGRAKGSWDEMVHISQLLRQERGNGQSARAEHARRPKFFER